MAEAHNRIKKLTYNLEKNGKKKKIRWLWLHCGARDSGACSSEPRQSPSRHHRHFCHFDCLAFQLIFLSIGDKDVDITDFNSLATHFDFDGATAPHSWTEGNFDGDHDIDITDFNFLAANFAPDGYGASAVPEPSSLLLALLGLMLLGRGRVR